MSRRVAVAFAVLSVQLVCAASEQSAAIGRLIQNGQFEQARQALTTALEAHGNDADLWNLLGVVNAQENRTAAAEEAFLKAVRFAPELGGAWLNLGRLYTLTAGEDKKAETKGIAAYETVLRLDPANAEAHHQLALLLQWNGKFRESLGHLDLLPAEDRQKRPAVVLRCADEAALGNNQVASELAEQLLRDRELEEGDIAAILPVVESRNEMITLRLLEGLKERRLATDRTLPHLAALYERRGNLQGARKVYESAFENSPASARMLLELARVAWKERDYEGTLGYLAHARDLEPKNARIHFLFGLTCNEMKLPIEARKSLEAAVELVPDNPYYTYATGAVLLQWTDKSQAIPFLKRFVALQPGDARGHLALATAYFTQDEHEQAKSEARPLLANPQTRAAAEYLLGRIAVLQDDLESAIGHFRNVIAVEPKSPEGHAELGSVLFEKQDPEGARREADLALALDPNNYAANRTLLRLFRAAGDPRVKDQSERLRKLVETREEQAKLLQRTIEVQPW